MPFLTPLHMKSVRGKRGIVLTKPLDYFNDRYEALISVPAGAYSNFGSIPAVIPPIIVPRVGRLKEGFVIHDWLYETKGEQGEYTRYQSDMILHDALKELGVSWWRRAIVLAGVRANVIAGYNWGK